MEQQLQQQEQEPGSTHPVKQRKVLRNSSWCREAAPTVNLNSLCLRRGLKILLASSCYTKAYVLTKTRETWSEEEHKRRVQRGQWISRVPLRCFLWLLLFRWPRACSHADSWHRLQASTHLHHTAPHSLARISGRGFL